METIQDQEKADSGQDLVDQYLGRWTDKDRRYQTIRAYRSDLRQFFGAQHVTPDVIRDQGPEDVRNWVSQWTNERTIRRKLASLHSFYEYCIQSRLLDHNPAGRWLVERPQLPDESAVIKGLNMQEYEHLIQLASSLPPNHLRDQALIKLGVSGALRAKELLGVKARDLKKIQGRDMLYLSEGKGSSGKAYVNVSEDAYATCQTYIDYYSLGKDEPLWRIVDPEQKKQGGRGFRTYLEPMTYWDVYKRIKEIVLLAGFDRSFAHPHVLRHTFGVIAADQDINPEKVRQHMRHKKIDTTMTYYKARDRFNSNIVADIFT